MPLREDLKNFIPKFLWTTINHPQGYIISAEEFNSQWNLNVAQGDHTAATLRDTLEMLYDTILDDVDGAQHIFTQVPGVTATNVKAALAEIRAWLDTEQTRVNTALSTATTTANNAAFSATAAVNTANAASTNASAAVLTANGANVIAESAVETASQAQTDATNAVTTANTALNKATQVEADFNAWTPTMEQAVNTVAGKADVSYVDQLAANFQAGAAPDNSIMEIKLHDSVKEKLNVSHVEGTFFTSDTPNALCHTPIGTSKYQKYLIPLATRAELDALMPNNTFLTMFNLDIELCKFGFNNDIGEITPMPHIIISLLLENEPNYYISGSYATTNLMGTSLQNLDGTDVSIVQDASNNLYVMLELTYNNTAQPNMPVVLRSVEVYTNNTNPALLNFANPWSIIGKFEASSTIPTGYSAYPHATSIMQVGYVPDPVIPPSYLSKGRGTFNSTTGVVINLPYAVDSVDDYDVFITPMTDPTGFLGEFWVIKGTSSFVVHCSGSTTTTGFAYIVF